MEKIGDWYWLDKEEGGSSNDEAKTISQDKTSGKYVISLKRQTAGRGRRGRSWVGMEGNLFMSQAIQIPMSEIGKIVFVVSLSLLESLKNLFPQLKAQLKWPNDILIDNQKISGILMEKGAGNYLIIGIGVNIIGAPQLSDVLYPAAGLADKGLKTDRITLLKEYLQVFDKNYKLLQDKGFAPIREKWLQQAKGIDEPIEVHLENENKIGIFKGIDENGALILQQKNKLEKIYAGDIFYI